MSLSGLDTLIMLAYLLASIAAVFLIGRSNSEARFWANDRKTSSLQLISQPCDDMGWCKRHCRD